MIYAVDDPWREGAILATRKRPPYNDDDLEDLLAAL